MLTRLQLEKVEWVRNGPTQHERIIRLNEVERTSPKLAIYIRRIIDVEDRLDQEQGNDERTS